MCPIYGVNSSSSFLVHHFVGSTCCYILDQTLCFFRVPSTETPFTGCVKRELVIQVNTPIKGVNKLWFRITMVGTIKLITLESFPGVSEWFPWVLPECENLLPSIHFLASPSKENEKSLQRLCSSFIMSSRCSMWSCGCSETVPRKQFWRTKIRCSRLSPSFLVSSFGSLMADLLE